MSNRRAHTMCYKIEKCEICQIPIREITSKIPGSLYVKQKLNKHVKETHGITMEEYLINHCGIEIPKCACGCGKNVAIQLECGGPISFNKFIQFHDNSSSPKFQEFVKKMKVDRLGPGNPMFGKKPWNKGVGAYDDLRMFMIKEAMRHRKMSEETKQKHRNNILSGRNKKFHHRMPHTEETKEKIRLKTLEQIKRGCFSQLKSSCHIAVVKILQDFNVDFIEEKVVGYYSYDIYLTEQNVYIEIDGDYWHSNPKYYPDGPKTSAQKVNFYRDKRKDEFSKENNMIVYRFWEDDINNNLPKVEERIREIICKHRK